MSFLKRSAPKPVPPERDFATMADQLRRAGADLAVPHVTRHFVYVPGVKAAQMVARRVKAGNRGVDIETSARTGFWLVIVSQPMVVSQENLAAIKGELESVAQSVGGEYDRWQVEVASA